MTPLPDNVLELLNANLGGFNTSLGLRFVEATLERVAARIDIDDRHLQPYGLVHGGVYAGMLETLCSAGSFLHVFSERKSTVGLENTTAFLRAVRSGTLLCTAEPVALGRRTHVWEGKVLDDRGRLAAAGRVRLLILEAGAEADGETIALRNGPGLPDRTEPPSAADG